MSKNVGCEHRKQINSCSICRPFMVFKAYRFNAKLRKRVFALTEFEFRALVAEPCYYCGEEDEPRGVDRWDNQKGYIQGNCVPCCSVCNYMKGQLNGAKFIRHVHKIARHV